MELSRGILKNFAQITNDSSNNKTSTSVHATAVVVDGVKYARIDGSNVLTPISETTDVQTGDRILVTVENHKAVVIGNFTYPPSARNEQKALEESERASSTANSAIEKAGEAQSLAADANTLSSQANTVANQAVASAQQASTLAQNAQTAASEANTKSDSALASASESLTKSNAAQKELDALKAEVETVQGDVADARAEAIASVNVVKEDVSVNYAKKTEVTAVEGSLKAEITKSVSELQSTISEQYTAKSDSVALEERLQSQITQNADNISSVVSRTTRLETDTSEAQKQIDAAKADAAKAQSTADAAQAAAKTAKDSADAAQSAANTAQENATAAQTTADAAKAKAEAANIAAANAQTDLDNAKANLNEVANRVGATEEEIAAAQQAVDDAQAAADQAIANAASANTAASNAQTAADKAKADAANAQSAANTAQTKADKASAAAATAQAAADKAQADADALKSRVTTCETNISQNAEAIALRATKTELTDAVDGIQVGGRNLIKNSKGDTVTDWIYKGVVQGDSRFGTCVLSSTTSTSECFIAPPRTEQVEPSTKYTFSCYIYCNDYVSTIDLYWLSDTLSDKKTGSGYVYVDLFKPGFTLTKNKWIYVTGSFTTKTDSYTGFIRIDLNGSTTDGSEAKMWVTRLKLEKGNKATDWSPAPEDQDDATKAVADNLASNYYNKTQTDAQIKVKADSILSTVSSTYQTKDAMGNYSTTAQMKTAIEQSATSIKSEVSATYATNEKVDGIQVGGRNLLLNSGSLIEVSYSSYHIATYAPSSPMVSGEIYTLTICVTPGSGVTSIGTYVSGGYRTLCQFFPANGITKQTISKTFTVSYYPGMTPEDNMSYADVLLYRFPNDGTVTGNTIIHWVKLERGNKATDWTPAPEDVDSSIGEINTIAEQTANQFKWIVKSGTSSTDFTLTDRTASLVANYINLNGLVTFSGLNSSAKSDILDSVQVGGRNLYYTYTVGKSLGLNACSSATVQNGEIVLVASGSDLHIGQVLSSGASWNEHYSPLMDVEGASYVTFSISNPLFTKNYYNFLGADKKALSGYASVSKSSGTLSVPDGAKYLSMRIGYGRAVSGTTYKLKIKVEKGNKATDWSPAPEDTDSAISAVDTKIMNWCYNNDVTYINGGKIYTGTVTADKISVSSLEAICAKIGGFTIGSSALYNNTTALAGAKNSVYLGTDGISCGTTFKVTKAGALTARSGTIGSITVTPTYLYKGTGTSQAGLGGKYAFWAGADQAATGTFPFSVTYDGTVTAKDLTLYQDESLACAISIYDAINDQVIQFAGADGGTISIMSDCNFMESIYVSGDITVNGYMYIGNDLAFENSSRVGTTDYPTGNHIIANNKGVYFKTTDGSNYRIIGMSSSDEMLIGMSSNTNVTAKLGVSIVPSTNNKYNLGSASSVFDYVYTSTMRIGLNTYSDANAAINTKWKDGNTHNILTRGTDGLTSAIGWEGSSSYATVLKLNSRTVQVVNSSGTSTLSDGRLKKDFRNLEAWEQFYLDLKPIAYKYKDGSSGRNHMGFVAQQVEEALLNNGLTTNDFAGIVKYDVNPDDEDSWHGYKTEYGLIYTEFTALNTYMTQKNTKAVKDLSHRFTVLDGKVNSTYARMASAEERIDKLEKENKQLREEIAQLKMAS